MTRDDHMCLCERCIGAIRSRGEKVFKLESLTYCEPFADYDEEELGFVELVEDKCDLRIG